MTEIISRGLPNAVTYDISKSSQTTITLPAGSTWSSELHWHETHTEYLIVVKGSILVHLGDKTRVVSAGDGEVKIDRFVWHEWSRASPEGEDVVVIERTDPDDGEKQLFFRALNTVILGAQRIKKPSLIPAWLFGILIDIWIMLNLCIVFKRFDNFPVFLNFQRRLFSIESNSNKRPLILRVFLTADLIWTRLVLRVLSFVGQIFQLHSAIGRFSREEVSQSLFSKRVEKRN
jgi:uncharacterized RmlC-like cupin family protein